MRKKITMRHLMLPASAIALLALAACADPAARQAEQDMTDHQNCVELGFEPNTEAYGNCRLKMREIRAKESAPSSPNIGFGVGIGIGKSF